MLKDIRKKEVLLKMRFKNYGYVHHFLASLHGYIPDDERIQQNVTISLGHSEKLAPKITAFKGDNLTRIQEFLDEVPFGQATEFEEINQERTPLGVWNIVFNKIKEKTGVKLKHFTYLVVPEGALDAPMDIYLSLFTRNVDAFMVDSQVGASEIDPNPSENQILRRIYFKIRLSKTAYYIGCVEMFFKEEKYHLRRIMRHPELENKQHSIADHFTMICNHPVIGLHARPDLGFKLIGITDRCLRFVPNTDLYGRKYSISAQWDLEDPYYVENPITYNFNLSVRYWDGVSEPKMLKGYQTMHMSDCCLLNYQFDYRSTYNLLVKELQKIFYNIQTLEE